MKFHCFSQSEAWGLVDRDLLTRRRRHERIQKAAQFFLPSFTTAFILFYWLSATIRSGNI